nr:IclR family transcriptional regulator [Streptomyces sp. SID8352]
MVLIDMLSERGTVSLSEVARELDVATSTAHRLLNTLVFRSYAVQGEGRLYHAGPRLDFMAQTVRKGWATLTRTLRSVLMDLLEETGETVHLIVPAGAEVCLIDGLESHRRLRVATRVGTRLPAYCSAAGKAILAQAPWPYVEELYSGGLTPWPYAKLHDIDALRRHLEAVKRRGYAVNSDETEPGVTGIAMCVHDSRRRPVAALSVTVPTARFERDRERPLVETLRQFGYVASDLLASLPPDQLPQPFPARGR